VKDVVVFNIALSKFCKALYSHGLGESGLYELNKSSYAAGVLISIDQVASTGTVIFNGRLNLDTNGTRWPMGDMLESGQVFMPGPYYLSSLEPGKLTSNPGQRAIYIGYFTGSEGYGSYAMLSPQYRDFLLGHSHNSFMLEPRTAGFHVSVDGITKVLGYAPVYYRGSGGTVNSNLTKYYGKNFQSDNGDPFGITQVSAGEWPDVASHGTPIGMLLINYGDGQTKAVSGYDGASPTKLFVARADGDTYSCTGKTVVFGRNRLVLGGTWYGTSDTTYTFTLGKAAGEDSIPYDFADCYLYWRVNNGSVPDGRVRMLGYNIPTYIGVRYDGISTNPSYSRTVLTDVTAQWQPSKLVGFLVSNLTDGSSAAVISNTANTLTVNNLVGGTRNSFQIGDEYTITGMSDSGMHVILQDNLQRLSDFSESEKNAVMGYVTEAFDYDLSVALIPMQDTVASRYRWELSMPEDMRGWTERRWNNVMTPTVANPAGNEYNYTFALFNSQHVVPARPSNLYTIECGKLICWDFKGAIIQVETVFTLTATIDSVRQERKFKFTAFGAPEVGYTLIPYVSSFSDNLRNLYTELAEFSSIVRIVYDSTDPAHGVTFVCDPGVEKLEFSNMSGGVPVSPTYNENLYRDPSHDDSITVTNAAYFAVYDGSNAPLYDAPIGGNVVLGVVPITLFSMVTLLDGFTVACLPFSQNGQDYIALQTGSKTSPTYGDKWTTVVDDESFLSFGGTEMTSYLQYNLGADTDLNSVYPPVPLTAAVLARGGLLQLSSDEAPGSPNYIFRVGLSSIYWYSNYSYYMPFPENWVDRGVVSGDDGRSMTKLAFANLSIGNSTVVTSLQPVAGSAIKVVKCGTSSPATTGDLAVDVDLSLQVKDTNTEGAFVVKQVSGLTLARGPVVERIISSDGSVRIVSSLTSTQRGQGIIDLSTNIGAGTGDVRGAVDDIMLLNAKQDLINIFPYIKILPLATALSGFIAKFRAPYTLSANVEYKAYFYLSAFPDNLTDLGAAVGLSIGVSVLEDYTANSDIPDTPTQIALSIPFSEVAKNDPIVITNDPNWPAGNGKIPSGLGEIVVKAGYVVAIKILRATASGTVFTGNLGILDMNWALRA
jgi:hypothetical protein